MKKQRMWDSSEAVDRCYITGREDTQRREDRCHGKLGEEEEEGEDRMMSSLTWATKFTHNVQVYVRTYRICSMYHILTYSYSLGLLNECTNTHKNP